MAKKGKEQRKNRLKCNHGFELAPLLSVIHLIRANVAKHKMANEMSGESERLRRFTLG